MAIDTDNFAVNDIANWTSSTAFRMSITGGQFRANAAGDPALEWRNTITPGGPQYSQCIISTFETTADNGIGPAIRCATGADTCYWFFHNTVDEYRLVRMSAGSIAASLGSYTAGVPATGDLMKLTGNGSDLKCFVNGVERISAVDATLSSGRVGVRSLISSVVAAVDDWEGGDGLSAALSGTVTTGITEANIVAGGRTIILTLTSAEWIPS